MISLSIKLVTLYVIRAYLWLKYGGVYMLFAHDGKVKEALVNSLVNSISERKAAICETWDEAKVMALPWGVKAEVEPEHGKAVGEYMESVEGTKIELPSGKVAHILKTGVKERKGKYMLIYRYELV